MIGRWAYCLPARPVTIILNHQRKRHTPSSTSTYIVPFYHPNTQSSMLLLTLFDIFSKKELPPKLGANITPDSGHARDHQLETIPISSSRDG